MDVLQALKSTPQAAFNKLIEILKKIGLSVVDTSFAADVMFGWLEQYINAAVCPECLRYLGDYREVPDYTICTNCKSKIRPIKIMPHRVYLCIANNANLFDFIPNNFKVSLSGKVKKVLDSGFGKKLLEVYDTITLDIFFPPLMNWLKRHRPDIYFTIVFYPRVPKWVQTIYDIDTGKIKDEDLIEVCQELGLSYCDKALVREVIVQSLDELFEEEYNKLLKKLDKVGSSEKTDFDDVLISLKGIKYFATQVEDLKLRGRDILEQLVRGGKGERKKEDGKKKSPKTTSKGSRRDGRKSSGEETKTSRAKRTTKRKRSGQSNTKGS